ncbi:MAG: EF-hand domain-containing protein [Verrucomicrobiota bacterium]
MRIFALVFASVSFAQFSLCQDDPGRIAPEQRDPGPRPEADGKARKPAEGGDRDPAAPRKANSKEKKVFGAYDADDDGLVTADEIVAMMEAKQNSRGRREVRKAVDRADKNGDELLDFDEWHWWYTVGRLDEDERNR